MTDADDVLQGIFTATFSVIGLAAICYCVKLRLRNNQFKKSASTEDLSSVDTTDPTQTQDEERYALPPILVTIASPRMGSSSAGR
jgi:hypothetical protein